MTQTPRTQGAQYLHLSDASTQDEPIGREGSPVDSKANHYRTANARGRSRLGSYMSVSGS
jgi:hypothetical protein